MIRRICTGLAVLALAVLTVLGYAGMAFADQAQSYAQSEPPQQTDQQAAYRQSQDEYTDANNQANQQTDQSGQTAQSADQNQQQSYQSEQP